MLSNFTAYVYAGQLATSGISRCCSITRSVRLQQVHRLLHELPEDLRGQYVRSPAFIVDKKGWGRNFVTRRLLEARSIDEALNIVMNPNCFVGHNYQIMSLSERRAYDVEVAPFGVVGAARWRKG